MLLAVRDSVKPRRWHLLQVFFRCWGLLLRLDPSQPTCYLLFQVSCISDRALGLQIKSEHASISLLDLQKLGVPLFRDQQVFSSANLRIRMNFYVFFSTICPSWRCRLWRSRIRGFHRLRWRSRAPLCLPVFPSFLFHVHLLPARFADPKFSLDFTSHRDQSEKRWIQLYPSRWARTVAICRLSLL